MNLAAGVSRMITRSGGYSAALKRLDLAASLSAAGDSFSNALSLPLAANNYAASKETGEPNHAGNTGGKSVWGKWTAPYTGPIQIDTHGSSFQYAATVTSGGPASAISTRLTITLPSGVSYQSASRSDGGTLSCALTGQVLSCSLGTLYAGNAVTIYVTVAAAAAADYVASGSVSSAVTDPVAGNNSAAAAEHVAFVGSDADAPTLPQWAALLLGALLLGGLGRLRKKLA